MTTWPQYPPDHPWFAEVGTATSPIEEVWVGVVVITFEVVVRQVPATAQLSAGQALFARRVNETRTSAKVVAAATSQDECWQLLVEWKQANPGTGGEDIVTSVPLGRPPVLAADAGTPAQLHCIGCGQVIGQGFRCEPCTRAFWAATREVDADWERG